MEKEDRHSKADKSEQGKLVAVTSSPDEIYDIIAQQLIKYRNRKDRVNPLVFMTTQGG